MDPAHVGADTTRVSDLDRYLFDLNGFLVIPGALSVDLVGRLTEILEARCAELDAGKPASPALAVAPLLTLAQEFRDLIDHEPIVPYLTEWLGKGFRLDHEYAVVMRPRSGVGGAPHIHGGGNPFNPSRAYAFQQGAIRSSETAVSYALTDVRHAEGGMGVIPGSHKANLPLPWASDPGPYPEDVVRPVLVTAGSAIIFTESLSHCSLPWSGRGHRRTLFYKYTPRNILVSSPSYDRTTLPGLSARQRALLEGPHT